MISLDDIQSARRAVSNALHRTPVLTSERLSALLGVQLFLKAELFQKTGSFKPRGMLNRVQRLDPDELERGLITASAGNAAQGLAWAASRAGAPCVVVMPESAPQAKVDATRAYGAEVVQEGRVSGVFEKMREIQLHRGLTFVHPFDDHDVISGHGTIGLEILEDVPDVEAVIVPVGGGGLIAGIASAVKLSGSAADVVGVEPEGAAGLHAAWEAGSPVHLPEASTLADGLAAPMAGSLPLEVTRRLVDRLVLVSDEDILEAMELLMTRAKLYPEPAGAAALAALLTGKAGSAPGSKVAVVVSGGNLDFGRLTTLGC